MNVIKLVLGGVVAVMSAFGMTITVTFIVLLAVDGGQRAIGVGFVAAILHSLWFWLAVFVVFAVGLLLTYRKLYLK